MSSKTHGSISLVCIGFLTCSSASAESTKKAIILTHEQCAMLVVDYKPVEYSEGEDVDGNSVTSADLSNSSKIATPKEIAVPINIDVTKHLKPSNTSFQRNINKVAQGLGSAREKQKTIATALSAIDQNNEKSGNKVTKNLEALQKNVVTPNNPVTDPVSLVVVKRILENTKNSIRSILDVAPDNLAKIEKNQQSLMEDLLNSQQEIAASSTPHDKDPVRNQVEAKAIIDLQSAAETAKQQAEQAADFFPKIQENISQAKEIVKQLSGKYGAGQFQQFTQDIEILAAKADQVKRSTPQNSASIQENLQTVIDQAEQISKPKYDFIDKGMAGSVKVDTATGRVTYNGQALYNEDQAKIEDACRRAYKDL